MSSVFRERCSLATNGPSLGPRKLGIADTHSEWNEMDLLGIIDKVFIPIEANLSRLRELRVWLSWGGAAKAET